MEKPLLVTAAMIIDNDKILLIKRTREPFRDKWCFVGGCGAFEHVNDPQEAVKIEVDADLNCDYSPEFFTYHYSEFKVPTITLFFSGQIGGTPRATPEYVKEFRWFKLEEARKMELGFEHSKILSKYMNGRAASGIH